MRNKLFKCFGCGDQCKNRKKECSAWHHKCIKCNKYSHLERFCPTVNNLNNSNDIFFPTLRMKITDENEVTVNFLLTTGFRSLYNLGIIKFEKNIDVISNKYCSCLSKCDASFGYLNPMYHSIVNEFKHIFFENLGKVKNFSHTIPLITGSDGCKGPIYLTLIYLREVEQCHIQFMIKNDIIEP
ncbi:hypothetical protein A3Q56_08134, partial [Intoshia linei]